MRLLLDTHSFLWFAGGNEKLSETAKETISDADNVAYLSEAGLWEMAIKINIGKLKLPKSFDELVQEQLAENKFEILRSELSHFETYIDLPLHHRDPFDRMMIAQAKEERLQIVGKDSEFEKYDVETLW